MLIYNRSDVEYADFDLNGTKVRVQRSDFMEWVREFDATGIEDESIELIAIADYIAMTRFGFCNFEPNWDRCTKNEAVGKITAGFGTIVKVEKAVLKPVVEQK
jgi:hypothetical protein